MDGDRFDALAKALSGAAGRRHVLSGLLGGALGVLRNTWDAEVAPKKARRKRGKDDRDRAGDRGRASPDLSTEKKKKKKKKKKPKGAAGSAISCPACGACSTCVLGGSGCRSGCEPACLAQELCQRANAAADFRRLAAHLAGAGYQRETEPEAFAVADADGPLRRSMAARYQHRTRASEEAVLWYVEEASGESGSNIVIHLEGLPDHALVVEGGRVERLAFEEEAEASTRRAKPSRERVQAAGVRDWFSKCAACEAFFGLGLDHPCGAFAGIVCGFLKKSVPGALVCAAAGNHICGQATDESSGSLCTSLYCCGKACVYQPTCCNGTCLAEGQVCCGKGTTTSQPCPAAECCDGKCGLCGGVCCEASECKTCVEGSCRGGCKPPAGCGRAPSGERECICPNVAFQRCTDPSGLGETTCCDTRAPLCHRCENGVCTPKCQPPKVCEGELIPTCECPEDREACGETCCGTNEACCAETDTCGPQDDPCCPNDRRCDGRCCSEDRECCNGSCEPKEFGPHTPCGANYCCEGHQECCNGYCEPKEYGPHTPCGDSCCTGDRECCNGVCRSKEYGPYSPCGADDCCSANEECCNDRCVAKGTVNCGTHCCQPPFDLCCGDHCCDKRKFICKSGCDIPGGFACCFPDSRFCCTEGQPV